MRRVLSVVVLVGALGCSSLAGPPAPTTMTGLWNVTMATSGAGNHCATYGLVINFTQVDSTFTGVATAGNQLCNEGELPAGYELAGTSWKTGVLSGTQVSFDGPSSYASLQCALTSGTMVSPNVVVGGVATCNVEVGLQFVPYTGTWSATRVQ